MPFPRAGKVCHFARVQGKHFRARPPDQELRPQNDFAAVRKSDAEGIDLASIGVPPVSGLDRELSQASGPSCSGPGIDRSAPLGIDNFAHSVGIIEGRNFLEGRGEQGKSISRETSKILHNGIVVIPLAAL